MLQEFIRVGYYVNNDYDDPEMMETPPEPPQYDRLKRNILASNPRVTKFKINWEDPDKYKSPLEDENCPPIPNTLPPTKDKSLEESPLKKGLAHHLEDSNPPKPTSNNDDESMDLDC